MEEFKAISEKYCNAGVSIDNIEYAVTAVKFGSNPAQIIEHLKVGYKSMNEDLATAMLKDLFVAQSIEIKRKKRNDFVLGLLSTLIGFTCMYYILHVVFFGGVLHRSFFVILTAIVGIAGGVFNFIKSFKTDTENFTHEFACK